MVPLDKRILEQYIDACAQVKETKAELEKIRRAKKRQEQDVVKGSSHDFPYTMQTYRIEGLAYASMQEPGAEDRLEEVIRETGISAVPPMMTGSSYGRTKGARDSPPDSLCTGSCGRRRWSGKAYSS